MLLILRDYVHWRKNYFPSDPILITKSLQREFLDSHDTLNQHVHELLAQLRRNFPFYSPRYIAHELSDTLLPATLGYLAGMLFNPNNVTPEAAPVTTEMEIDACSSILRMLGFTMPPPLPDDTEDVLKYYARTGNRQFGWAHITSGGTIANIEALWVARQVRYFPLAVKELCEKHGVSLEVKLPSSKSEESRDISELTPTQLLLIKPNESIYMLPRLVKALRQQTTLLPTENEGDRVWELLNSMPSGLSKGVGRLFADYPPVIFVAGTRHYSITKAADILGIGQANIVPVDVDASFRIKTDALKKCIRAAVKAKRIPLAVVATAGTTEEGAVDPIDGIISVREALHAENISFWLHIDAAWSGFIRSLFNLSPADEATAIAEKATAALGISSSTADLRAWNDSFDATIRAYATTATSPSVAVANPPTQPDRALREERFQATVTGRLQQMRAALDANDHELYSDILLRFPGYFEQQGCPLPNGNSFALSASDRKAILDGYVRHELILARSGYRRRLNVLWPPKEIFNAFLAFPRAESIAVDPHKMGYAPYPSGCVAFRNDRARLFILQKAPYITSAVQNPLFHVPPRHAAFEKSERPERRVIVESFSPYMLEGSKPGAAAASLWLSTRTVPLTMRAHGSIVRASILAARDIYEWLKEWHTLAAQEPHGVDFQFVPLTPGPPDTNLVTFVVKKRTSPSLTDINSLTSDVYKDFTILSELGERQYSYSQSFFLSRTIMKQPEYPAEVFSAADPRHRSLFTRCQLGRTASRDYRKHGLVVLRATVMNPYLTPLHDMKIQDMARTFVEELATAAATCVRAIPAS
jgi:glutamate/tyrosine decarboxylase-like PLP-dependent enzyme